MGPHLTRVADTDPVSMELLWREALGAVLRRARTEQQRILTDIAAEAGVSPQYLSEIERGRKEASSEILRSVCDALELPIEQLLGRGIRRMTAHRTLRAPRSGGIELCAA